MISSSYRSLTPSPSWHWGVGALLLLSVEIPLADAQQGAPSEVVTGQEIALSIAPSPNTDGDEQLHPDTFRSLPGSRLHRTLAKGSIGVVGVPGASNELRGERVVSNEAAIKRQCKRLLRENPDLNLSCEPNLVVNVEAVPNDQHYPLLWGLQRIDAPLAWERSTGDNSVIVAVVDTGIEYTHPDLQKNIAINDLEVPNNGIDDDQNGYIDDYFGFDFYNGDSDPIDDHFHGTHCAGTIGAEGNNSVGVTGVAWNVSLLPVKVIGGGGYGTIAAVAAGISYGVQRGAKVISLSLSHGASVAVENAIAEARDADVVVVAAAGNSGMNNDLAPVYPANSASPNVVSVAASDNEDLLTWWSNFGALTVDVAAPGLQIYSTGLGGGYRYASGTSMATPHVAGIVALMRAAAPSLSFSDIKTILLDTVDSRSELAERLVSGGRVNVNRALAAALGEPLEPPTPTPTPTVTFTPTMSPTPTPSPTSTPTATASPTITTPPVSAPGGTPELTPVPTPHPWPRRVKVQAHTDRTRTYIEGLLSNRNNNPVRQAQVFAICRQRIQRIGRTDDQGYFRFSLTRTKRRRICYVRDETGVQSKKLLVF